MLRNDTAVPLVMEVVVERRYPNGWRWTPAAEPDQGETFTVAPGAERTLPAVLAGRAARVRAHSEDGTQIWSDPRQVAHPVTASYTFGMKTAVSLPDAVFERAERLATRLGKSRSELYRDALALYLAAHDDDEVTAAMDRVVDAVGPGVDAFVRQTARGLLERERW